MNTNEILFHRNAQFLQCPLPFLLDLLSPLQLLFPSFVQALHKFFARLHLILELSLGDCLDAAILGLVRDLLFLWRHMGIVGFFTSSASNTS